MGNKNNKHPLPNSFGSVPPSRATSPPPIIPPCALIGPTKPDCPAAVDAANTPRPSSPSTLTLSLSSTPVVTCFDAGALPQSPVDDDDDDDTFYDALDNLPGIDESHYHKPVHAQVIQVPQEFGGAAKGRTSIGPRGSARPPASRTPATANNSPPPPTFFPPVFRGSSKAAASPAVFNPAASLAAQAQLNYARLRASEHVPRREATKKALLVGINYQDLGKGRLWHAVRDASRFRDSLKSLGFQHDNVKLITDESGFEAPTYATLMQSIGWLVSGAVDGDVLFFVFSGHCVGDRGLVTSDKRFISRHELHHYLVMQIPSGCELQIVFDCCAAAALIQLQYCVGRMGPLLALEDPEQSAQMNAACESEANPPLAAELPCPPAQPRGESPHLEPLQGSFHGLADVAPASPASPTSPDSSTSNPDPAPPAPITPPMVNLETFAPAPSNPVVSHRRGGVVAAPPPPSPAPAVNNVASALGAVAEQASEYVSSWFGRGQAAAPTRPSTPAVPSRVGTPGPGRASTSGDPRRGRQVVVEGDRTPDHFEERKGDFIQPAGKVMVWAGSGEGQQAFEAFGGRHGIVTNAMCSALDACATNKTMLTRRDIWRFLVGDIDKENAHRSERDAKKSLSDRQDPKLRVQHAQLWVSQVDQGPLSSAAPALDQPMIKT